MEPRLNTLQFAEADRIRHKLDPLGSHKVAIILFPRKKEHCTREREFVAVSARLIRQKAKTRELGDQTKITKRDRA